MARFLFTVWPFHGHFYPDVAIAHALRERGHEVAFYTGTRAHRTLEDEGFRLFKFKRIDEAQLDHLMYFRSRLSLDWRRASQLSTTLRTWLLGTVPPQVADLEEVLAEFRPDAVACDPTMWGPILVLHEKCGIPVAVSSFIPACLLPGRDAPPFGLGLPRPRDWHTRLVARLVTFGTDVLAAGFRRAASALRQCYGLPPLTVSATAFTGRMPLYLVPSAPEFDYERHDLPPAVHYVGTCLWNKPRHESPAAWLAELPRGQPWVHVTEGTMHVEEPFLLRAAAQGLGHLPIQLIMTTGTDRDPENLDLGPRSPNTHVVRWLSHSELLPRTDVVVTTGGAGTVMAALAAGVPLVVVPTEWDKPENAQRVVEAGVGLRLSPGRCTPRRLAAAVERVLDDASFRRNAQRLAAVLAGYGGPVRAAELLEGICGRRDAHGARVVTSAQGSC